MAVDLAVVKSTSSQDIFLLVDLQHSAEKNTDNAKLSLEQDNLSAKCRPPTCVYLVVVPYSITSVGHGADPGFLAVSLSPHVTLVINSLVGCRYFLPGPRLLSQLKRSLPWPVPNYTAR